MGNSWQVPQHNAKQVEELVTSHGLHPIVGRCIVNRGILKHQDLDSFLHPREYQPPDPFLLPDMDRAVERIARAIRDRERICIYGDYDADGVSSIAILTQTIRSLGGQVFYYVPDRFFEGVGLNNNRINILRKEEGVSLVITVDTGSRSFEEMEFAQSIGIDVIITDHHSPGETRPAALAVLNPKIAGSSYPFRGLCGAGVAFKLAQGLDREFPGRIPVKELVKIAAIGTIADMVPLRQENRWIVATGLREIDREERGPIRGLLKRVGIRGKVHSLDISFRLAPRINAPGRLGDPDTAIAFFESRNPRETQRIIETMEGMNTVRQLIERDLTDRLENQIQAILAKELPAFVLLAGRNWHRGILGIMACKMLRRLARPVCILSYGRQEAHGSIRSLSGMDLMEPLNELAPLLNSFGGHAEAAGVCLPITNIPQFKARMNELLTKQVQDQLPNFLPEVDAEVQWDELDRNLFRTLLTLAPFGVGNPTPVFLCRNLILESELMRKGPWFHFEVSDGALVRRCSYYHPMQLEHDLERFDSVDLLFSMVPFRDDFQIQVVDLSPSA